MSKSHRFPLVQFRENCTRQETLRSLLNHARYDAFGQMAAEYHSTAATTPVCSTCYLSNDWLGSTRLVTDASGNVVSRHDFTPFGQEIAAGTAGRDSSWAHTDGVRSKFTGQLRDTETGMDYFIARYYGNALGRFISPDPANIGTDPSDPQTWNAYAYVRNNPLAFVDPTGLYPQPAPGQLGCTWDSDTNTLSCGGTGYFGCVAYGTEGCIRPVTIGGGPGQISVPPTGGGGGGGNPAGNPPKDRTRQTFNQCMAANASNFSLVGTADKIFGTNFRDTFVGGLLGGNSITGFLYGSGNDNAQIAISNTPEILTRSMGTVTTYGRRTSTVMSLNFAGKGGLPQALGTSGTAFRGAVGTAGKVLGLGLSFEERLAVDGAFTATEIAYCVAVTQ
ncbi:MAG TPA: RHS repeat-associated core domain-containing protein [Bryobacteraceae bacterium]|nr:RHS repeat-associated core domain-containing protein [Bryobacteraceae bacterium]